jgi:hypothetical protein
MNTLYLLHIYILFVLHVSMYLRPPSGGIYISVTQSHLVLRSKSLVLTIVKAGEIETKLIFIVYYNHQNYN